MIDSKKVPQSLIERSIGICKCMEDAIKARLPLHIIKMYEEESISIAREYDNFK